MGNKINKKKNKLIILFLKRKNQKRKQNKVLKLKKKQNKINLEAKIKN